MPPAAAAVRFPALAARAGAMPWVFLNRNSLVALPSEPKDWIQLTRGGSTENDTFDGRRYVYDLQKMVDSVNARAKDGVLLAGDPEHLHLDTATHGRPVDAYAWFDRAELRNGPLGPAIWVHVSEWTPLGAEKVRNKYVRYASPVFPYPADGKTITDIESVGFVLVPNMKLPQVMNRAGQGDPTMDPMQALAEIAAQLGLGADATPEKVVEAVKAFVAADAAEPGEPNAAAPALVQTVQANRLALAKTLGVTGKVTGAKLLEGANARLVALGSEAAKVPALTADLAAANARLADADKAGKQAKVDAAWERNRARITPAAEAAARKHCELDPDAFEQVWKDMPVLANSNNAAAEAAARAAADKARGAGGNGATQVDVPAEARELVQDAQRNGRRMTFVEAVNKVYAKHGIDPATRK